MSKLHLYQTTAPLFLKKSFATKLVSLCIVGALEHETYPTASSRQLSKFAAAALLPAKFPVVPFFAMLWTTAFGPMFINRRKTKKIVFFLSFSTERFACFVEWTGRLRKREPP